ncbi:hypothetical protein [Candidatus Pseudoscillospira sp. SGI.172]|uniref:hypothetical protein n=1 Tax=Candidatus Pseudoscillospira sp. SGI.172 TaxID=3420582 RepID=UPI003CFF7FB8
MKKKVGKENLIVFVSLLKESASEKTLIVIAPLLKGSAGKETFKIFCGSVFPGRPAPGMGCKRSMIYGRKRAGL